MLKYRCYTVSFDNHGHHKHIGFVMSSKRMRITDLCMYTYVHVCQHRHWSTAGTTVGEHTLIKQWNLKLSSDVVGVAFRTSETEGFWEIAEDEGSCRYLFLTAYTFCSNATNKFILYM